MSTLTNYRGLAEADYNTLDRVFDGVGLEDPVNNEVFGRLKPAADGDDLLLESGGQSVPDSVTFFTVLFRSFKTVTPILLADMLALAISGVLARWMLLAFFPGSVHFTIVSASIALLPIVIAYWMSGLYTEIWVHPAIELRQLTHLTTVGLLAAGAAALVSHTFALWCATACIGGVVLVPFLRNIARRLCAGGQWWGYPTLIIGTGKGADAVARTLLRDNNSGLRPVLLTDPQKRCRASILPVINDPATLESVLRSRTVRHAVVSLPDFPAARLAETLDLYSGLVPHLLVLSDHSTLPTLWSTSRRCGRVSGIEVRNGLTLYTQQAVKRGIDLVAAACALCIGLPVLAGVAVLVKTTSSGPVFFGHSRIGRHGKRFKAWKFRTMQVNADAILREHLESNPDARGEWDRDHKLRDDPRVTKFGRIARKTSLDELPQLWNVLMGDMSLVGPRPIVDGEVWRYKDTFRLYTTVKPGITGMWQVSGRNDIGYDERVLLDQFYIRHWSPWLDVYILAKTVVALMQRSGAY